MGTNSIVKIVFLVLATICGIVAVGCGLVFSKKKYNGQNAARSIKLMRVRAICFILMLVMLLVVFLIK